MIIVKNAENLEGMRISGGIAAGVRDKVASKVSPGVTTMELADYAADLIKESGAISAFLGYRGFPGQICVSVNEEVVHGIPSARRIEMGDIVSVDVGVKYDGYYGDTATTVMVGVTDQEIINLIKTTEESLVAGIDKARSGGRLSDISHAVEQVVIEQKYTAVRDFVGHGIGRQMHEDPQIPNYGNPGRGPELKAGMTFCIEPMVNMGVAEVDIGSDGWTVSTRDRLPSAHFEHMIAITEAEPEILTL